MMLHTKYQSSTLSGFRREDLFNSHIFYYIYCHGNQSFLTEFNYFGKLERGSPKEHSCQVSSALAGLEGEEVKRNY
jgi:hypothetical protein